MKKQLSIWQKNQLTNSNSEIVFTDPTKLHGNLFAEAPKKFLIAKNW